jgi:hypothetical protein
MKGSPCVASQAAMSGLFQMISAISTTDPTSPPAQCALV